MLKLYKRVDGVLHYHEAWMSEEVLWEHWGVAGERGESKGITVGEVTNEESFLAGHLLAVIHSGFCPIALDDHVMLVVEYQIAGMGTAKDLEKRDALEDRLDQTLGWTGLGHCDGGSIGSGTMEAACFVVDFDLARRAIVADLCNSPFANYTRIYQD